MLLITSVHQLRGFLLQERLAAKAIGLVPTMGALHEGHLALVAASRRTDALTVCSIFVNPIQFNNPDDLAR